MSVAGVCEIKSEYIIDSSQTNDGQINESEKADTEADKNTNEQDNNTEDEPPANKKVRLSKSEKKKFKGQNKSRPATFKTNYKLELCKYLTNVTNENEKKECTNSGCPFLHDVQEYLKNKPKDIGLTCYNYLIKGHCTRGLACRFASCHITSDGFNKINKDVYEKYMKLPPTTKNQLPQEIQHSLRKRIYDFKKSVDTITAIDMLKNKESKAGCVTDEDVIKLRNCEKKNIDWNNKLYLSPLTTVGNLPFRRICKEYGADITCGEMAMSSNLLQGAIQEWALVKRHESEDIFGVQLCGNNPYVITKSAQLLQEKFEVDFIDLNLGCPIDLVYRQGGGSGLLHRERVLECIVRSTSSVLDIPLTVKTRTGIYANNSIAHKLVPKFRDWGASMVTIHGRSREQRYTKQANWRYINECAELAKPLPVFGNGDVLSYEDFKNIRETHLNVSGVMIGRGALIKPWLFTEIKEQRLWDISSSERFDILKKYVNYGLEHWGSDNKGVENTRRFMLEWLSFLYRYVPVGVLEHPPQKINQRPPCYKGRDDLETLMASSNCSDWIKISEMLLGPVPENFNFLPKHKANSY